MIKLHEVILSEDANPRSIWVNPANILWINERFGDELGGTDIHFPGTMLMVSESTEEVLQLLGHLVIPKEAWTEPCDFGCTCEKCTKSRKALNREEDGPKESGIEFAAAFGLRVVRLRTCAAVRDCLATELELFGLPVVKGRRAQSTLRNTHYEELNISLYIAMNDKSKGQKASFTASGFMDPERPWFMFVVRPWGRVYLRRREEVMENLGDKALEADMAFVTISKGRRDCLFENRIDELINDKENWRKPNDRQAC